MCRNFIKIFKICNIFFFQWLLDALTKSQIGPFGYDFGRIRSIALSYISCVLHLSSCHWWNSMSILYIGKCCRLVYWGTRCKTGIHVDEAALIMSTQMGLACNLTLHHFSHTWLSIDVLRLLFTNIRQHDLTVVWGVEGVQCL
jgi:hypothetical protein